MARFSSFALAVFGVMFFSSALRADPIDVTIRTVPGESWRSEELDFVKKAADVGFQRIATSDVANCAYRNTFRDKLSKDQLRERWGRQIPVINVSRKVTLTVHRGKFERKILGMAKIGTAEIDRRSYEINNLDISLNQEIINEHVADYSKKTNSDDLINQWSSVIAHEVAHNFGYTHGTKGTWSTDYPGYFATELGFCTMTNGKFGSDLGDENLRREQLKRK